MITVHGADVRAVVTARREASRLRPARTQRLRRALLETAFSGRLTGSARVEEVIEELARGDHQPGRLVGGRWVDGTMHSEGVVITSRHELELWLSGHDAPDGEINFADLGPIAASLQELATRIGRHIADQTGTGRSFAAVENAAQLRLRDLTTGSVNLVLALGQAEVLDLDDGLEEELANRLWDVILGMAEDWRPDWTPPLVAESAVSVLNALQHASTEAWFSRTNEKFVVIRAAAADRSVWRETEQAEPTPRSMIGQLKMVDIEQAKFRLRDDVGNSILLHHVVDPDRVAGLVGQRVTATGPPVYDSSGKFLRLDGPTIEANPIPLEWTGPQRTDIDALIASARSYDPDEAVELTDREFDDFMTAIKG